MANAQATIDAASARCAELKALDEAVTAAKNALNTMTGNLNETYPRFDVTNTGDVAGDVLPTIDDYRAAINALEAAVEAFEEANGDRSGMTDTDTDELIAAALALINAELADIAEEQRIANVEAKAEALENAIDALNGYDLNATLPYVDADDIDDYEALIEAVEDALADYEALTDPEVDPALIDEANEAIDAAEKILTKNGTFTDYEALYAKVLADINRMDDADQDKADALLGLNKIRADYSTVVENYTDADYVVDVELGSSLVQTSISSLSSWISSTISSIFPSTSNQ